ncbi:PDZ and LIM domain protein 7, partial [Anas platyrhynchos]
MESYKVMLNGPAPWGFRLQGGKDFSMPLSISRLTPGGKAAQAGVGVGDWVLYIDGESTSAMTHIEAQNRIRACGDRLCLTLSRAGTAALSPKDTRDWGEQDLPRRRPVPSCHRWSWVRAGVQRGQAAAARPLGPIFAGAGAPWHRNSLLPAARGGRARASGSWTEATCMPLALCHGMVASSACACPAPPRGSSERVGHLLILQQTLGTGVQPGVPGLAALRRGDLAGRARQPPQHPTTPIYDPSKLHLIEDSEDWQPRNTNTQSRSFLKLAQLTGTDSRKFPWALVLPAAQGAQNRPWMRDEVASVCGRGGPAGCGMRLRGTAGITSSCAAGAKRRVVALGTVLRPPWAVDPSFAERYAPDKTSTVLSKHSQPATPTPMQNRSSIVQAAQQAPEGLGRTPLCYKCNKVIRGRYLVALGHYYHPEEFTCCQCRKVLDEGGFFEEKGSIFCPKCYDTRYAPSCAKCKKKITGVSVPRPVLRLLSCKTPIRNRAFYMEEGQPYCERDYEKMFGTKCRGCDFKIDAGDRFLEALGFSWHDTCFVCAICQTNLEGKTFYSKKDKPLCKSHAFS